ncbi:MAG: LLM class flavin-dependent oxidoreductase [Thermodesulfobacteriota bacteirum]|jgi:5,10-methylenetetrahydromethanopterin reductase|nr:LLM class flavin-dependent oxidoreductase [Thermodesulfobacteriota bacterium]
MKVSVTTPVWGCSVENLIGIAKLAEDSPVEALLSPEVPPYSALANAQIFAEYTKETKVGTWISNIYLRHPVMCAAEAMTIQELTGGRLLLGLGVSHKPVNSRLGIEMGDPIESMRDYVNSVRSYLDGSSDQISLKRKIAPVPIYIAGLTEKTAELAGEIADGLMPYLASADHLKKMRSCVDKGRSSGDLDSDFTMTTGLPSFISDDLDLAVESAIKGLSGYARLPFYQRVLKLSGYEDIVKSIEDGMNPAEALTPELVSDLALVGPIGKCKETLAKFAEAGADMPIITPNPVGKQSPLEVMEKIIEVIE